MGFISKEKLKKKFKKKLKRIGSKEIHLGIIKDLIDIYR